MKASLILDLVLLAILLAVAFGYARKGFLAGLIQFAGNLASLIGAVVLSQGTSVASSKGMPFSASAIRTLRA